MSKLKIKTTWQSYIIGMHNPIIHGLAIVKAWIKLFHRLPSLQEGLCILFHDIGYLQQDNIDGEGDRHPELGANICRLMGKKYYELCICHSRDYAQKLKLPLSKLCFADKGAILQYPAWFYKNLIWIGGEAVILHERGDARWGIPVNVFLIKKDYRNWLIKNMGSEVGCL